MFFSLLMTNIYNGHLGIERSTKCKLEILFILQKRTTKRFITCYFIRYINAVPCMQYSNQYLHINRYSPFLDTYHISFVIF